MDEKEKRKREAVSPWLRPWGVTIIVMSLLGAVILSFFLVRGFPPRLLILLICVFVVGVSVSAWILMRPKEQDRPTLNQIRQSPNNPLIVQQWNGRTWVDTLDMQSAVRDAQDADSSHP